MSAKYPFFGKKGRPSKVEREICKKINKLVDEGTVSASELTELVDSHGQAMNQEDLETLYAFMTGETPLDDNSAGSLSSEAEFDHTGGDGLNQNIEDAEVEEMSNADGLGGGNNAGGGGGGHNPDAVDFDPFAEPVIERDYTKGEYVNDGGGEGEQAENREGVEFEGEEFEKPQGDAESVAEEVGGGGTHTETHDGGEAHVSDAEFTTEGEVEEDIPEAQWNNTIEEEEQEELEEELKAEKEPLGGDNLQDLTPAQKRKSAEKTADAILQMYCKFAPLPFKSWASFSDKKVQKLALEGRIDLNMPLENGVTVQDYIDGHNEQVEEIFEVDEETQAEIRDPLIDVLMEQELALTPTQRLLMAVGSHVVTMGFSAFKLASNNKQSLEAFEKYHADMKAGGYQTKAPVAQQHTEPSSTNGQTVSQPQYNSQEFSSSEREAVEELLRDINKDEDDVIDPEHDASVTVEEVTD